MAKNKTVIPNFTDDGKSVIIPADLVRAARVTASKDKTRPVLCSVAVYFSPITKGEGGECALVSTDSYRLLVQVWGRCDWQNVGRAPIFWTDGPDGVGTKRREPVIIPEHITDKGVWQYIITGNELAVVFDNGTRLTFNMATDPGCIPGETYPNFTELWPKVPNEGNVPGMYTDDDVLAPMVVPHTMNMAYVADLARVGKLTSNVDSGQAWRCVWAPNDRKPVIYRAAQHTDECIKVALQMPVREG